VRDIEAATSALFTNGNHRPLAALLARPWMDIPMGYWLLALAAALLIRWAYERSERGVCLPLAGPGRGGARRLKQHGDESSHEGRGMCRPTGAAAAAGVQRGDAGCPGLLLAQVDGAAAVLELRGACCDGRGSGGCRVGLASMLVWGCAAQAGENARWEAAHEHYATMTRDLAIGAWWEARVIRPHGEDEA
jgi:hypothetical protein